MENKPWPRKMAPSQECHLITVLKSVQCYILHKTALTPGKLPMKFPRISGQREQLHWHNTDRLLLNTPILSTCFNPPLPAQRQIPQLKLTSNCWQQHRLWQHWVCLPLQGAAVTHGCKLLPKNSTGRNTKGENPFTDCKLRKEWIPRSLCNIQSSPTS